MIKQILIWLGLAPSKRDEELRKLISNSYTSIEVVGRGTIKIDPKEVSATESFKRARQQAKSIVERDSN